jgi:hypothetical protein
MPIALHAFVAAALAVPAAPVAATTPQDCAGDFSARSRADLATIAVLDAGPLARGLPALTDVHLATAEGTVESSARPYRSIASGRFADARTLGLPAGGAGARHAAPGRGGPDEKNVAAFRAAGLTAGAGRSTAYATWDDDYRCGSIGPLTRSATMLAGLSVLDGAIIAGGQPTSLLKIGPTGSTQSATDLVHIGNGRIGVRSGVGASLGDLSFFAGTPQEISVKVVKQPALEVVAGSHPRDAEVDYRPAVLRVTAAGRPVHLLKDAGAAVSLGLIGNTVTPGPPAALEVRLSLGDVKKSHRGRQVEAEASTLRVEVKLGMTRVLDVSLGNLSAVACAPAVSGGGGHQAPNDPRHPTPAPASPSASASPYTDTDTGTDTDNGQEPGPSPSTPTVVDQLPVSEPSDSAIPSDGTGGGVLALTGADVTLFGFAGVGLVLAGLISLLLTRRRRTTR